MKGILLTGVNFALSSGDSIHTMNICECLKLFSEVKVYSQTAKKNIWRLFNYGLCIFNTIRSVRKSPLDYIWIRSFFGSTVLKVIKDNVGVFVYDLNSCIAEEREFLKMNKFKTKVIESEMEKTLSLANIIRVHNEHLKRYVIHRYKNKVPDISKKISVIPIPIVVNKYPVKRNFRSKEFSIVYAGGTKKWQGLEHLIDAIKIIDRSDIRLTIYSKNIPDSIKRSLRKNIFLKYLPHEKLIKILANYDLFVIPRPSNIITETSTPLKFIEAMACGVPILASDVGGINEFVKHKKHAYLVKPGDPEAIAEGILEIIENKELAQKMSENSRKLVEKKFDYKIVSRKIEKLLNGYLS